MSENNGYINEPSLSRDQAKALGALAEELGELNNDLKLSYKSSRSRAPGSMTPELWEIILIYLSGNALDAATQHAFDSVVEQTVGACRRWFRKQRSMRKQVPTRRFAIFDQDGNEILRFEMREGETNEEIPTTGTKPYGYALDLVLIIDVSGSMSSVMDFVKENALSFQNQLMAVMKDKGWVVHSNRVRVIAFRNFLTSPGDAIESTQFLVLPEREEEFHNFISRLRATGGGAEPKSGLEALALAIGSPWERHTGRSRHVIALFTDAAAHPIVAPDAMRAATYPEGIPSSFVELSERWGYRENRSGTMDNMAKRLVLFAPDIWPWSHIASDWDNTIFLPSSAGQGLTEWEMREILDAIANELPS